MSGEVVRFDELNPQRDPAPVKADVRCVTPRSESVVAPIVISRLGAPLLQAWDAHRFLDRLRGLYGKLPLAPTQALIIRPCRAIHTWRLPHPIDVAFLNREGEVLRLECVPPGGVRYCAEASVVIEMAEGTASRLSLAEGHVLTASFGEWL